MVIKLVDHKLELYGVKEDIYQTFGVNEYISNRIIDTSKDRV